MFFSLIQHIFKPSISSLNSSIIIYFFEGVKGKGFFGIFKKLTVCFDLVQKSLYLFVSGSSDFAELYSGDGGVPKGKLNFFVKIRSSVLNFAFLYFVGRLSIFPFLH